MRLRLCGCAVRVLAGVRVPGLGARSLGTRARRTGHVPYRAIHSSPSVQNRPCRSSLFVYTLTSVELPETHCIDGCREGGEACTTYAHCLRSSCSRAHQIQA